MQSPCNNLKLNRIFNGPYNIDRTNQSAIMGGPLDHPWFQPILHTENHVLQNHALHKHIQVVHAFILFIYNWLIGLLKS